MASNILKFHPSNLITGINIVDDMLFFTDGVNEPKKIDLNIFRAADHTTGNTIVYGRNFQERDITVIRPHPQTAITTTTSASTAVINPIASAPLIQTDKAYTQSTDVVLYGQARSGTLPFTERGFVYKQIDSLTAPTLQELLSGGTPIQSHSNGGRFDAKVSGLVLTKRYYYIAYAKNNVTPGKIYAKNVDGTDDIETFVINDTSNAAFTPNLTVETTSIISADNFPGRAPSGSVILHGTIISGTNMATITNKGFYVYKTVTSDTITFGATDILMDVSSLNNKNNDVLFSIDGPNVHSKFPNGDDDSSGHSFITTIDDFNFGDKLFVQAFASTGIDPVERVGKIKSFPISASTDPNNKAVQHKPNPSLREPDQNNTSVTMKARIDHNNWNITASGRLERGFYFSKKEFDVKKITTLTFASGTGTEVDQGYNGRIEWKQATNDPEIFRVSQFWDGGYMQSEEVYAVETSAISAFSITRDEDIYICAFGRSNFGEGYERHRGKPAVKRYKAGTGSANIPITITANAIRFTAGKIEVDVTIAHNTPVATEMGLYFTSQEPGVELGNGTNLQKQGMILDRARRQNDNFARMIPGPATSIKDINGQTVLDTSTQKIQAGDFTFQYGFDIDRFPITNGTGNVSSKLPIARKDYYAMPFVKVNNQEIYGSVIGPPKLGNINEPPDIETLNYTGNQISGGQPKVTFNGQVFEQLSNTPTLTEAGFIYGTNADEVAAGTGSTIVAVSGTVTSNTPTSISLLNSFLGQQGTAGQTPKFSVQATLTGQHGQVIYYIAYVKISGDGGNTLHLAEDDNQTGDYGKGVVRVQLQGTTAVTSGVGTRLPVPELLVVKDLGRKAATFRANQGDNGGSNKSLTEMTPKFYYMKESSIPSASLYRGSSTVTEATTQAYIKNNAAGSPNATSGVVTVTADTDDLSNLKNAIATTISGLDANTRYVYFVTSNNGVAITSSPFAQGEGPSKRCFSMKTQPAPPAYPNGQRAFAKIIEIKNVTTNSAEVHIKWTGGGGDISTITKHGVYYAKTSAMTAPYTIVSIWNANPAKTFVSTSEPLEDIAPLTGLTPGTEYHVCCTMLNDNTLGDIAGMTGSGGEGISSVKKFTTLGGTVANPIPVPVQSLKVNPTRIIVAENGKKKVFGRRLPNGSPSSMRYANPSFTIAVSPKDAELKDSDITFPAYNFLNPKVCINKLKLIKIFNGQYRVELEIRPNTGFFSKPSLGTTITVKHPNPLVKAATVEISQAGPAKGKPIFPKWP